MYDALVITPVKDSLITTIETIKTIKASKGNFKYCIFNDFSTYENTKKLESLSNSFKFDLVNLADIVSSPSPNYRTVLQMAQEMALKLKVPLIIVESDVEVKLNTFNELIKHSNKLSNCGIVAAITVDENGEINFPYKKFKKEKGKIIKTTKSLTFCCTLITEKYLKKYSFNNLDSSKHWYDVSISRKSIEIGFFNYISIVNKVLHKPHSSRPWKRLKYKNVFKYYLHKWISGIDKI